MKKQDQKSRTQPVREILEITSQRIPANQTRTEILKIANNYPVQRRERKPININYIL